MKKTLFPDISLLASVHGHAPALWTQDTEKLDVLVKWTIWYLRVRCCHIEEKEIDGLQFLEIAFNLKNKDGSEDSSSSNPFVSAEIVAYACPSRWVEVVVVDGDRIVNQPLFDWLNECSKRLSRSPFPNIPSSEDGEKDFDFTDMELLEA